jgi:hypothetical protein
MVDSGGSNQTAAHAAVCSGAQPQQPHDLLDAHAGPARSPGHQQAHAASAQQQQQQQQQQPQLQLPRVPAALPQTVSSPQPQQQQHHQQQQLPWLSHPPPPQALRPSQPQQAARRVRLVPPEWLSDTVAHPTKQFLVQGNAACKRQLSELYQAECEYRRLHDELEQRTQT